MKAKFAGQVVTGTLLVLTASLAAAQENHGSRVTEKEISVPAPSVTGTSAPSRPVEMTPKSPIVTCGRDGQLAVVAENSTLGSILAAVQACLGVRFDVPQDSREQRAFLRLGPGPAPAVLRSLLETTDDDFVIEPSASNPTVVHSVVLIARTKTDMPEASSGEQRTLTAARRAWIEERRLTRTPGTPTEEPSDNTADTPADAQSVAENPVGGHSSSTPSSSTNSADALQTAAAQSPATAPATDTTASSATGASSNASDPVGQFQNQVMNMQELFQQRQQMIQNQAKPQPAAPSPSPQG